MFTYHCLKIGRQSPFVVFVCVFIYDRVYNGVSCLEVAEVAAFPVAVQ